MPNLDKDFYLDKQGLRQLVNELETNIVASEYDTTVSYTVGQYCVYENNFYRCTTATTGTWDSTAWVKVIIGDELSQSSGASSVAQLEDVQLSNLSDNDLLVYDSNLTGGKLWKNAKKIVTCTKAQFDDWSANNTFPYTDCKYIITDSNNLTMTSADIPYDSTGTDSVKDVLDLLLDRIYPIGSIYMSVTDSTVASVEARFGGTWERISEGKALFGYSTTDTDFQTIGSGGGNKTVNLQHTHGFASNAVVGDTTLTASQSGVPAHAHTVPTHGHSMTQPAFSVSGGAKSAGITGGSHHHTAGLTSAAYVKPYQQFGACAVASGSNYTVPCRDGDRSWGGDTSSNTHTHDLPSHSHTVSRTTDAAVKNKSAFDTNNNTAKDATAAHNHSLSSVTTNSQLSTIQNVLNPYITVYMYKRTA